MKKRLAYFAFALVAVAVVAVLFLRDGSAPPQSTAESPTVAEEPAPPSQAGEMEPAAPAQTAPVVEQLPEEPRAEVEEALDDALDAADFSIIAGGVPLSPEEAKKAEDIYLRERDMWLAFKGFSGDMRMALSSVQGGEELVFDVEIEMGKPEVDRANRQGLPVKCNVVIHDKGGKWTWKTNDFREVAVECDDEHLRAQLERTPLRAVVVLLFPKVMLSLVDAPDYPSGEMITREKFFAVYQPRQNPEARGAPGSYAFINIERPEREPAVLFENGHMSALTQGTFGAAFCRYGSYEQIGDFAFPMSIEMQEREMRVEIRFANVKLAGEGGK